jgi:hypothetical protein
MAWTVDHPKYGHGIVKQSRNKGFEFLVDFEDGRSRWVRRDQITVNKESTPSHLAKHPAGGLSNESRKARRMIEAFRMGIVPLDCVSGFTFGRQAEIKQLSDWLNNWEDNKNSLLVVGAYGTGKTHLLNYIYGLALNEKFAGARVEMDPLEVPFHKPKRAYSRLVQTLRFCAVDNQVKGFRDLVTCALDHGLLNDQVFLKHLDPSKAQSYWEWIEGVVEVPYHTSPYVMGSWYDFSVPRLFDDGTSANVYCNLLSSLSWSAREALGLNGLLLLFDEAETVDTNYSPNQVSRSLNFLRALVRTANNDPLLTGTPWYTGLAYSKRSQLAPFIYRIPTRLKVLFAFTPSPILDKIPELNSALRLPLDTLADNALETVFGQICRTYTTAYRFDIGEMTTAEVFERVSNASGRTRMFVKASVEALDLLRLNPMMQSQKQ